MKYIRFLLFLALLTISGCQNELYENALQKKAPFEAKTVSLNDIPEVDAIINQNFGNIKTGKFKTNKSAGGSTEAVFETNNIIEVVDTLSNKNYSIRFSFSDTPANITYNLIVNILPDKTQNIFVEKYTCNPENFEAYKNNLYSFKYFKGRVDLYRASAFFNKTSLTGKTTSKDPCLQLIYPNGDPVPSASSFIDLSGTAGAYPGGGSGSDNPYIDNGYSYGPVTWTYYPPNESGDTTGGSTTDLGCCSCGNCGTHYYPPSERPNHTQKGTPCDDLRPVGFITLNAEPEALRMLRIKLPMTVEQWQWLHGKDHVATALLNYVNSNPTVTNANRNAFEIIKLGTELNLESKSFPLQILNQMSLNPNLLFDVRASYFSPYNIDRSAITNDTPEGQKFNEIYDALLKSPEFKNLFVSMFGDLFSGNYRHNVKFELADAVYDSDNPTKEINANTTYDPNLPYILIKINKKILNNSSMKQTKIENAKTVLHEFIHAYLYTIANNPIVGPTDIASLLNKKYPVGNKQHDFMYNDMIPTMQKILGEIRDLVTTQRGRNVLENEVTMHPTTNPLTSTSWIWNEYYKYLSLNGLNEANCFKVDFPKNSDQWNLLSKYIEYGHNELDK
ncbi:hypothetical protein AAEO57_16465 [Flavobacterium sp. DGU38]|uniref:SprT-like family protein n=1 Tax=Flavobacterium calami TaxID=3139144 RepID=A0ABU9IT36_9FLAO